MAVMKVFCCNRRRCGERFLELLRVIELLIPSYFIYGGADKNIPDKIAALIEEAM
jgi:hypothetical protein